MKSLYPMFSRIRVQLHWLYVYWLNMIWYIVSGGLPPKSAWRHIIKRKIKDWEFKDWRFNLKLYSNLKQFSVIIIDIELCGWWTIARKYRNLKGACCTMLKLISNCNCLRLHYEHNIPHSERVCLQCNDNVTESTLHFVLYCSAFNNCRRLLFNHIGNVLECNAFHSFMSLSDQLKCNVMLCMDYPLQAGDLELIRCYSAYYLHRMYKVRQNNSIS